MYKFERFILFFLVVPNISSILQANTPSLGQVKIGVWCEEEGTLSVYLSECRNLFMGGKQACHYYIQSCFLSNPDGTRKLSQICSGTQNPKFNTELKVSIIE